MVTADILFHSHIFIWILKFTYFILILNYWMNMLIKYWIPTEEFGLNRKNNTHLITIVNISLCIDIHKKKYFLKLGDINDYR